MPFSKVYSGFSKPAVITVACVIIISQVIRCLELIDFIVHKITFATKSRILNLAILSIISSTLSTFINNVKAFTFAPINADCPSVSHGMGGLVTLIGDPS
ncbi:hypothetical protein [Candidatus Coxiella mudrowiae]|uniref:hypothetical protein n=1 Tax=Candidatus Coxiella mudrowiae TaxID=2054173 RepID=UPI000C28D327|nr:hypothetical protein [Candidatus Coxiella mudrowiae]